MDFLAQKKKWFFALSLICFLFVLLGTGLDGLRYVLYLLDPNIGMANDTAGFALSFHNIVSFLLSFTVTAFCILTVLVCWITEKGKYFISGIGLLLLICQLHVAVVQFVIVVLNSSFEIISLLRIVSGILFPCILALYLIVIPLLKAKGPVIPVLGVIVILLGLTPVTISQMQFIWNTFVILGASVRQLVDLFFSINGLLGMVWNCLGFVLFVPLAVYIPWRTDESINENEQEEA